MTIWTPQNADTKRFALRMTLFTAALVAVAVGGWFLSTAAHSSVLIPLDKCDCVPENGLSLRSWKAGRANYRAFTFVTNEQTKCDLYARVSYNDPSEGDIHPKRYTWAFTSMSHGFEFAMTMRKYMHHFLFWGDGVGDPHQPSKHPSNGRGDKPMKIKIRFLAIFECLPACATCPIGCPHANSSKGKQVTYYLRQDLKQDEIDEMRQEYVDHDDHPKFGAISVPSRRIFGPKNIYVTEPDSYDYMVDKGLASFHESWARQCTIILRSHVIKNLKKQGMGEKEAEKEAEKHTLTMDHLPINSGYRNPEHNWEHVKAQGYNPAWHSPHQYGGALDVSALNIDMDDDGERGTEADKDLMLEAAEASFRELSVTGSKYKYTNTSHVHAEWRPKI
ncbi:MAG: hypothetical protein OXT69_10315 [Candidatus Poribacteria bacterium]|nr:hypothetical protein [Candidatus Poribacteria bacterium]